MKNSVGRPRRSKKVAWIDNQNRGILNAEEQHKACNFLISGIGLGQICSILNVGHSVIAATCIADKEFSKKWELAKKEACNVVEDVLKQKGMFGGRMVVRKYRREMRDGKPLFNADGTEKMYLCERLETDLPADNTAMLAYLRAHDPAYNSEINLHINADPIDTKDREKFAAELLKRVRALQPGSYNDKGSILDGKINRDMRPTIAASDAVKEFSGDIN